MIHECNRLETDVSPLNSTAVDPEDFTEFIAMITLKDFSPRGVRMKI